MNDLLLTAVPDLVVVGSINVDHTVVVDRLPAPGETIGGGTLTRSPGGKGANQAVAASRLGAAVRMVGSVGHDADGSWMRAELERAGVDTSAVRTVTQATGTALVAVDRRGENQIVVAPGANGDVVLDEAAVRADLVLTQFEGDPELVLELARRSSGFLVVNAAPARPLPAELVERVDLFIVNETEYALMPELGRATQVAVTYGGDGAALVERGVEVARVPAERVGSPVNTVGAGDAFCAALTVGFGAGLSGVDALRAACGVGADAVRHESSQPPFRHLSRYLDVS